ncbi:MAG TPA: SCO family protein [Polyangiaceae bacterium]|jgi:protein SCO1/2
MAVAPALSGRTLSDIRTPPGIKARAGKLLARPLFWTALVGVAVSVAVSLAARHLRPPALRTLGSVPDFHLLDQRSLAFGTEQLRGKVWVAGFIFTRCPTVCPKLTRCMGELQAQTQGFGQRFHMVSFTVDPEGDTPSVLSEYAKKYGANQRTWSFLTGTTDDVRRTVVSGMKIAMGREGPRDNPNSIFHGTKLALIDSRMAIRGYYECENDAEKQQLVSDIAHLVHGE